MNESEGDTVEIRVVISSQDLAALIKEFRYVVAEICKTQYKTEE